MGQEKWLKWRHKLIRPLLGPPVHLYSRLKYGVTIDRFKEENSRQYLVLFNHQTAFDQFFVSLSFRQPIYYLASEDLFNKGFVSSLIRFLVAPIPIKKQKVDISALKTCLRVAKEGGTIALAPEGNRTYSGETAYINPSVASLAKKLKLPIVLYRIEGGYAVHPRWSDRVRKGRMHCYVSRVIEPEEYAEMSNSQLFDVIKDELYVNEGNGNNPVRGSRRAEYLERAVYYCPVCDSLSTLSSYNNTILCEDCGMQVLFEKTTALSGVGFNFPYRYVADWYKAQYDYINSLDLLSMKVKMLYLEKACLYKVELRKSKSVVSENATVMLYSDRMVIDDMDMPFDEIEALTLLGKNKLNIYIGEDLYQLKGHSKGFNALKYLNIYTRYKNIIKGDHNEQFLGL